LFYLGPAAYPAAAAAFTKALRIYPEPMKLMEALAQSIPEQVVQLIIQNMSQEVSRASQNESEAIIQELE
jgi:hypothetical protein